MMNAPLVFVDVYKSNPPRFRGRARRQPWRWRALSGGNFETLASGESYEHEADAIHVVQILFGSGTNAYLRRVEHGNELLRLGSQEN